MSAFGPYMKAFLKNAHKKMREALPVTLFFLVLFYTILIFFGFSYIMTVPLVTVIFKGNYQKRQSLMSMMTLVWRHLFLAVLAFLAAHSFPLCLILNLIVPFVLIAEKSSQFYPMGYFSELMTFTFLQLVPVDLHGFGIHMAALAYALLYFCVVVWLYQCRQKPLPEYQLEQRGLLLFAAWIARQLEGREKENFAGELFSIQQELYRKAYHKSFWRENRRVNESVHYTFALMYQRVIYFVGSGYQSSMLEGEEEQEFCRKMAAYLKALGEDGFQKKEQREKAGEEGEQLLHVVQQRDEELYIFFQNFLQPLLSILKRLDDFPGTERRKTGLLQVPGKQFELVRLDSFEIRFALRMSVVLAVTFSYSMQSHAEHGFWLPLNAFILLRPMYEESVYRMKTRFAGTAVGSILMAFILPLLPGTNGHILFASGIVIGQYAATPGTWQQAFFSTCYGLAMTTLALSEKTALELRMLYVGIAVVVVLIVNKFFFPTSLKSQFRYNFQFLFHMQHLYLRILENCLNGKKIAYDAMCSAQLRYHLVHEQLMQYLKRQESGQSDYYRKLLSTSWKMISEMEQMFVLVNAKDWEEGELKTWNAYILYADYVLNQVQQMLHMKPEKYVALKAGIPYQRSMVQEPQLSLLMTRYSKNLSALYQMACQNAGEKSAKGT